MFRKYSLLVFVLLLASCGKQQAVLPKYREVAHLPVKGEGSYSEYTHLIPKEEIKTVFEIGSRDAKDALELSDFFKCHVWAFECNPMAVDLCKRNIGENPNVTLVPLAIWKEAGTIPFYSIPEHNIGASSCFPFNPIIEEGLVQEKIEVAAVRLDTFLKQTQLESIDLLCMDVQGAAYEVLLSLGRYLPKVKYIIAELEGHPIYEGGRLYQDVNRFLKNYGFKRVSVPIGKGQLFGDVLYVNARLATRNQAIPWPPNRGPIAPFISGDTFRAHCDFAYDEISKSLQPETVPAKSTIFVNGDILGEFLELVHPKILNPYILVVHNTDWMIPGRYKSYLDDPKILVLFTQNPDGTVHPKLHLLPIGIENRHWNPKNRELLQETKKLELEKKFLLYSNFNRETFPSERTEVLNRFASAPFVYTSVRKPYPEFVRDLAFSKFVLSPRGNGLDCHRTWEALYAGAYPVVRSSPLDPLFEGLPVVIVQNWEEVTESFLQQKFEEFSQRSDWQWGKIYIEYYLKQIQAEKIK